jgi:hypothetical protein
MSSVAAPPGTVHGEHRWDFVFAALYDRMMRSHSPRMARWQDRLETPWRHFGAGCRCNRDTIASIAAAGFSTEHEEEQWQGVPPIVAPLAIGRAVKR